MSHNMPCERCQRVGLVRVERIITGKMVTLAYFCGACEHSWQMAALDARHNGRVSLRPQKDRRQSA